MDATPIIGASLFIGTSIFIYIVAFIVFMVIAGYFIYRISPKGKKHREERRNNRR